MIITTLTSTLGNEYPSSNETSKKNGTVRGDCIACDALFYCCPSRGGSSGLVLHWFLDVHCCVWLFFLILVRYNKMYLKKVKRRSDPCDFLL